MINASVPRLHAAITAVAALPVNAADFADNTRAASTNPIIEHIGEPRQRCAAEISLTQAPLSGLSLATVRANSQ